MPPIIHRSDAQRRGRIVAELLEALHDRYESNAAQVRSRNPLTTIDVAQKLPGIVTERDTMVAFNDAFGSGGTGWFLAQPQYGTPYQIGLDDAIEALDVVITFITTTLSGYDLVAAISAPDQEAIAQAIEAVLEA